MPKIKLPFVIISRRKYRHLIQEAIVAAQWRKYLQVVKGMRA